MVSTNIIIVMETMRKFFPAIAVLLLLVVATGMCVLLDHHILFIV